MRKSLVLMLALTLGLSTTALAVSPFSDVPTGHWAYDSIAKLAAAGAVNGYPGGTFQGDKLMTRYEMAQIVAKALARGAKLDRLASEFSEELNGLGVRVARLEKKSDNVKIAGELRYSYKDATEDSDYGQSHNYDHRIRTQIYLSGAINDNWNYTGMLENNHSLSNDMSAGQPTSITTEDGEGTALQRAYLQGRLGGAKITAGYDRFADDSLFNNYSVWNVGAKYDFGGTGSLGIVYMKSNFPTFYKDSSTKGLVVTGTLKEAERTKPGSWGLWVKYYNQGIGTVVSHTMNGQYLPFGSLGFQGWGTGINYVLAKNMVGSVEYYDLNMKPSSVNISTKTIWSQLSVTF